MWIFTPKCVKCFTLLYRSPVALKECEKLLYMRYCEILILPFFYGSESIGWYWALCQQQRRLNDGSFLLFEDNKVWLFNSMNKLN